MHIAAMQTQMRHDYPVDVVVEPATDPRNRVTTFFRVVLAIPHLVLVGGPMSAAIWWTWRDQPPRYDWGASGGLLGGVACLCALIAWFAILFSGRHPGGLWDLAAFYLRWRVRVVAYVALLRDEYPPFGDGDYPVGVSIVRPTAERDKITVALRLVLILPHLVALWAMGFLWFVATLIAWAAILVTKHYPDSLREFAAGMIRWSTRVEAYALLLVDEYPPFSLAA